MARTRRKIVYDPDREDRGNTPVSAAAGIEQALSYLGGRWKLLILFHLFDGEVRRFSELGRAIPAVSPKMLSQQLRQMERDGIVRRIVHPQVPPKVEYGLTGWGATLWPALDVVLAWAARRPDDTLDEEGGRSAIG